MNVVLCYDGLDRKLCEEYDLSFLDRGRVSNLYRSKYMSTVYSWTSIYTGKTFEENGIPKDWGWKDWFYNQTQQKKDLHGNPFLDTSEWSFIWNTLPGTVGCFGLPLTYPAKPINGWMVSGFPSPNYNPNSRHCNPKEISRYIPDGYSADILQLIDDTYVTMYRGIGPNVKEGFKSLDFMDVVQKQIEERIVAVANVVEHHPVDTLMLGWNWLDHAGHLGALLEGMGEAYEWVDRSIEAVYGFFKPEKMLIVSDHGGCTVNGKFEHTRDAVLHVVGDDVDTGYLYEDDVYRHIQRLGDNNEM